MCDSVAETRGRLISLAPYPSIEVGERALDRAHVGAGGLVEHPVPPRQPPQEIGGVGELRHDLRVRVRRGLDPLEPDRGEALDQRELRLGRDEVGLVLEPVAGKALAEDHVAHRPPQSSLMPAFATTCAHRARSAAIHAPNASGVPGDGSMF